MTNNKHCKNEPSEGCNYACYIYLNLDSDMRFHGNKPKICSPAALLDYMKYVAALWWLLIYWLDELVAKTSILQTQAIGHLTEYLRILRGGIQGQSPLSLRDYSVPEHPVNKNST